MVKQHPLLRALRYATIAHPLAPRPEEPKQLIVPNRTTLGTYMRAIRAGAITGCIVLVVEAVRQSVYPRTSIWTSLTISILFTAWVAAAVTFVVLKKERNEALCHSEAAQRLAFIVEFSEDAIIAKNIDCVITNWNRAAEKMYGYTTAEAV